jgi:signal transduction histidine kinase
VTSANSPAAVASAVFGLLFEHSPDAAIIVNRETSIIEAANVGAASLMACEVDALVGFSFAALQLEPERDVSAPGRYEDVALRKGDDYPVYVELLCAHVHTPFGPLAAYLARDTGERRILERELVAKHTALFTAYAELERTHAALAAAQEALEERNREVALFAWRAAMGELVAGIAHHLNNPVGALASTVRTMARVATAVPHDAAHMERLLGRSSQLVARIEENVAAIIQATHGGEPGTAGAPRQLPPELAHVQSTFVERLDTSRKDSP